MEQCVGMIMDELANRGWNNHFSLAYQSRVGPVRCHYLPCMHVEGTTIQDASDRSKLGNCAAKLAIG